MAKEIERKFLVDKTKAESFIKFSKIQFVNIIQGYLCSDKERTVRVRIVEESFDKCYGYLTVKGITRGATRDEFEYEIPYAHASVMMSMCTSVLSKMRGSYYDPDSDVVWELDFFKDHNSNLVIAEVELQAEDQEIIIPSYVIREVTHDPRYYNSNLIKEQVPYA